MTAKALLSTFAAAATIVSSVAHADTSSQTRDPVISTQATGAETAALFAGGLGTTVGTLTVIGVVAGGIIVSTGGTSSGTSTTRTFFIPSPGG